MAQGDECVVIRRSAAAGIDVRVNAADRAEQSERLVNEVTAEVEQHTSALASRILSPLASFDLWAPALKARLIPSDPPECSLGDQAPQRELIGVPAAVLKHAQDDA